MLFISSTGNLLDQSFLTNSVWEWAPVNGQPMSDQFVFSEDGKITGYVCENEHSWSLDDGGINIYTSSGELLWRFEIADYVEGKMRLLGIAQPPQHKRSIFSLTRLKGLAKTVDTDASKEKEEGVRLVIWDLDETFWQGTLSEGDIQPLLHTMHIVRELNNRGIVNAICSKNDFEHAKGKLQELGLWDDFVFPRISWQAKGPQIKDIIEKIQLRPESVLFVDDNKTNLNEVKHFVPGIQVCEPAFLDKLLEDTRFRGKADPARKRLQNYKILEAKHADRDELGGSNEAFLRESNVRISFHTDVSKEFSRIHELVNRTNQLNFTKNRWPEDIEEARKVFEDFVDSEFFTDFGYIKVSDNYGNYGICGFYFIRMNELHHFLFSCRILNMGVEQFVWNHLKKPKVHVNGNVASSLENPETVDWIKIVDDADAVTSETENSVGSSIRVCLRGACDLTMTSYFLRTKLQTIEEFSFPYQGWENLTTPRNIALHEDLKNTENKIIVDKLPNIAPNRFSSSIIDEDADVYVLSFSQESFHGLYKSKKTSMILTMGTHALPYYLEKPTDKFDYTKVSYEEIKDRLPETTKDSWDFFVDNFEFIGGFNEEIFKNDVIYVLNRLTAAKKKIIVLGMNSQYGNDKPVLEFFGRINAIVSKIIKNYNVDYIDMSSVLKGEEDLTSDKGGFHYERIIYKEISDIILKLIAKK